MMMFGKLVEHFCFVADQGLYHNTGLSSSENWGSRLLTTEADVVTAHGNVH